MNYKLFISLVFLLPLLSLGQKLGYRLEENIAYQVPADSYQAQQCKLDIYYPNTGSDFPIVVWYHGGGLTGGRKEIPEALKDKGFIVVGVGYRLSPQAKVQDIIKDAAAAVAWVYANSERYRGDSSKVVLSGHSAGGYLALMLGLNKAYLKEVNISANSLAAIIPFSGQAITHFTARAEQGIADVQPTVDALSPLFWVRKDAAPVVLLTGDREKEMLGRYEENAYLARMLQLVGHSKVQLLEFDGYGHDMTYPGFPILVEEVRKLRKGP